MSTDAARSALSAGDALRDGQAVPKTLDGMPARAPERYLRRLLAYRVGLLHAYYDDGEAHGTEYGISIDFMREPVADIDAKLRALNVARSLAAAPSPTIPAGQTLSQKLTAAGFTRRPSLWAREAREALELIAAPMRPDGTWNRDREACRQLAAEALGRSEDAPTPLTARIVYPKIPPRKIQDDDEQPAPAVDERTADSDSVDLAAASNGSPGGAKLSVTLQDLSSWAVVAQSRGTEHAFVDLALEWAAAAMREIDRGAAASEAELSTLRERHAQAVRDAQRYQWLRDAVLYSPDPHERVFVHEFVGPLAYGETIDAAIDAAIAAKGDAK